MFKDKLKQLREMKGLSQQELADKLFVSRSAIAKWENGNGLPSDTNIDAICAFFNIDQNKLMLKKEDYIYTKKQKLNFLKLIICFTFFVFALILGSLLIYIDANHEKKSFEKDLLFYEKSIILRNSNNFQITEENLKILRERFDYVNCELIDCFNFNILDVYENGTSQPISIKAMSSDFINTGVMAKDTLNIEVFSDYGPQKIDLLYGKVFNDNSENYEIVIDLDTSLLCFGKENSVGKQIVTKYGKFVVIGVVSNTSDRERNKKINDYKGMESHYETYGYISNALAKLLIEENDFRFNDKIQYVIVSDETKPVDEVELIVKILFDIPKNDINTIYTRKDRLIGYTYKTDQKINILYISSSILLLIGILGIMLVIKLFSDYKKIKIN